MRDVPELLAPAGNLECLHAAVCAGADAVYLGLDEFNARRNAQNFTIENFGEACDYAHLRGVAVYVALNVEILAGELTRAVDLAREAYLSGADAFIVQDIGLAAELKRLLPQANLHVSTQMNVHNAAGIEVAARLGANRVTLARELSLAEIAELGETAAAFGMEVECFAHGALCVCYSGQCLMSSMIGGRSANRGLCAQACRLPYELHRDDRTGALPASGDHLLSPKDLCTIDLLDQLAEAGVASLKVEGRMKSADYVFEVVSVYREVLDSKAPAQPRHEARLAEAFSRGFTAGYLVGQRGNDIMSYGRPNNRGVFAGRVAHASTDLAHVACEMTLNSGDILEFWTNRGHFSASVPDAVKAGQTARIPIEHRVGKGDRVFRVRNSATAFRDERFAPRIALNGYISLHVGQPAHICFITDAGVQGEAWGDVVEPARTKAVEESDVRAHVDRLGQTPFTLERLDVSIDDAAGIGFSQLHRLRSDALDALTSEMLLAWHDRRVDPLAPETMSPVQAAAPKARGRSSTCEVMAWATNPGCARAAKRAKAACVYVPLLNFKRGQAQVAGALSADADQAGYPKQCVMALPVVDHDPIVGTGEHDLSFDMWDYVREGKTVFADNLADAIRAIELGARVEVGMHVPAVNASALRLLAEWGVSRVWLSPELTLGQIAELAESSPVDLGLFVCGSQELMVTEHCLLMSQGACSETCERCPRRRVAHHLVDRKGFEFPVITDALGRSHLYNGVELDAVPTLPDLIAVGISAVMVDTTLMNREAAEAAIGRVVRARDVALSEDRSVPKRPHATTGHLFRGIM